MSSVEDLAEHLLAEPRCDTRERPQQDLCIAYMDREKMLLINSSHGVSWEGIYSILFPGAQVPSPYYETCDEVIQTSPQNSPRSQELHNFESYQQAGLPPVVESEIRNIVNAEMTSVEATLRSQLEDIVRRCLAQMAENFQLFEVGPSATAGSTQLLPQMGSLPPNEPSSPLPGLPSTIAAPSAALDFFQEPPHLDAEASASLPDVATADRAALPGPGTDSGYESSSCQCSCHLTSDASVITYNYSGCSDCATLHVPAEDLLLDFSWESFD